MAFKAVLTACLVFAFFAAAGVACSGGENSSAADGGAAGDGGGGGGGGCESIEQCSDFDPRRAVCVGGKCEALGGDQATLLLNLGFRNAPEIKAAVTSFAYYALHTGTVGGGTISCEDLIGGHDPEGADLNLIQKYGKQLFVTGDMMQTATLSLPYMTGMILFVRVFGEGEDVIGLACTQGVTVPQESENGVGADICPADKTERCIEMLPE